MSIVTLSRGKLVLVVVGAAVAGSLAGPAVASGASHAKTTMTSIVDAHSHAAAKVTKSGELEVGDGHGPLTVDGTVTGLPYPAAKIFSENVEVGNGATGLLRARHTVDITSLTLDNDSGSTVDVELIRDAGATSSCTNGSFTQAFWSAAAPAGTTVAESFPSPLVVTDKCATFIYATTPAFVTITVTGWQTS
jgi:hypothetical protein